MGPRKLPYPVAATTTLVYGYSQLGLGKGRFMVAVPRGLTAEIRNSPERRTRRWLEAVRAQAREEHGADVLFCISPWVELLLGAPRPKAFDSERGLVEYALDVANGDADRSRMKDYLQHGRRIQNVAGSLLNPAHLSVAVAKAKRPGERAAQVIDEQTAQTLRDAMCRMLERVSSNSSVAAATYFKVLSPPDGFLEEIWTLPSLRSSAGGRTNLDYNVIITSTSAFHIFVSILLIDEQRPLGRNLFRCKLESCTRWFLAKESGPDGGRPNKSYCSKDHMATAHKQGNGARVRKSRAGVRLPCIDTRAPTPTSRS